MQLFAHVRANPRFAIKHNWLFLYSSVPPSSWSRIQETVSPTAASLTFLSWDKVILKLNVKNSLLYLFYFLLLRKVFFFSQYFFLSFYSLYPQSLICTMHILILLKANKEIKLDRPLSPFFNLAPRCQVRLAYPHSHHIILQSNLLYQLL